MLQTFYIYEITNNLDGRTYIGQRHCPLDKTPETDTKYMGKGKHILAAEKKYGVENFSKRILAVCYIQEILDILEIEYIRLYKQLGKAEFNIAPGGLSGKGNWTYLSEARRIEIKKKISLANKGKTISEEQRKILSDKLKGRPSPNKGNKLSVEARKKLSEMNKKRYKNPKERERTGRCVKNSEKYQNSRKNPDFRKRMSEVNLGKVCKQETREKLSKAHLGKKMPEGFGKMMSAKLKGIPKTEEWKRKVSESNKGKRKDYIIGTLWWNDGEKNYRSLECPFEGCVKGRLNFNNVGSKGMFWWTNGEVEVLSKDCPSGFRRGKLPMKEETKRKLSECNLNKHRI